MINLPFTVLAYVVLIISIRIVIKKRLYSQALLSISGLAGFICGPVGFIKLTDGTPSNDTAGAILVGIGILTVLAIGVLIRIIFPNIGLVNQSMEPGAESNDDAV